MAKFCTKCGKELKEGKACDCSSSKANTNTSANAIDFKECGNDCLSLVKGIFVKPVETIKDFVVESKLISAIIMIVVAALSAGLYQMAYEKAILASDWYKPKYLNDFFTTSLDNLVRFALLAALGYVVVALLFKGKTTWKKMVAMVGAAVSVIIVANLVNSILVFVDAELVAYIRGYVATFSEVMSILIVYKSIEETAELDKNKLMIGTVSLYVLVSAAMDLYAKIVK